MTELLSVYENLYNFREDYCVICLRSGRERRMVPIKSLEQFVKSINLPFTYTSDFQRLCWVCERAAAAALRLRLALNLSGSVHGLFALMARSPARRRDMTLQLQGAKEATGVVGQALEWEARLAALRARTALLPTEVLVVASVPPADPPHLHQHHQHQHHELSPQDCEEPPEPPPPDESDVYLIPDEPPRAPSPEPASPPPPPRSPPPIHDALSEPEIFMDSVIIEDDERDPIEIKLEEPPAPAPAPAPAFVPLEALLDDAGNTSFLLHPIVESAGVVSVPSLHAHIVGGRLVARGRRRALPAPRLALHTRRGLSLVSEPARVQSFLRGLAGSEPILQRHLERGAGTDVSMATTNREMQTLMTGKPHSDDNVLTHRIIIEDEEADSENVETEEKETRQGDVDTGRRKRERDKQGDGPPKKQKETDWEDKIPMDVISYMDATDPNAERVLREQPLGVISAVHSVSEEAHSGITSVHSEMNSAQTVINNDDSGVNSLNSVNSVHSGKNSVNSENNSVRLVLNSEQSGKTSVSSQSSASGGIKRDGGGRSVHLNVFGAQGRARTPASDVIDLC